MPTSVLCPHRRRAAVAVFAAVMLIVLFGFAALTVDVGYLYIVRGELQNAVDSAALAGAGALVKPTDVALARARTAAYNNRADQNPVDLADMDIELGNWDSLTATFTPTVGDTRPDACRVSARLSDEQENSVGLFFSRIFGRETANVTASATASLGSPQRWDIVIVQDVTGSFVDEIDEARIADQGLLDCIRAHAPETQLGLVVFTGYGKVWSPLKHVEDEYAALSAAIGSLRSCGKSGMPPCSGTNIGSGIDAAIPLLTGGTSERAPAMIIVSDGMPQSSLPGYTDDDLADWANDSANDADALGISIFTLFYSGNDGRAGAAEFLAGLVRGNGTAHETPDPDDIANQLHEICLEGLTVMLVE